MRAYRFLLALALALAIVAPLTMPAPAQAGDELMKLLPADATGVFAVDIKKGLATPLGQKMLEDKSQDYLEFIKETGINPETDLDRMVGSVVLHGEDDWDFVMAVKGTFDREKLMAAGLKNGAQMTVSQYEGKPLIRVEDVEDQAEAAAENLADAMGQEADLDVEPNVSWASFIDDSTVLWGSEQGVKSAIDVSVGKAKGMHTNEGLTALVSQTKTDAVAWAVFEIPEEMAKALAEESPMMASLADLRSVILMIDYEDETILGLIHANGGTAEKNAQLAEFLNGMKAFFAMGASEDPDLGALLESIKITSSDQHVAIEMAIPEELMRRITESAVDKASGPDKGDIE